MPSLEKNPSGMTIAVQNALSFSRKYPKASIFAPFCWMMDVRDGRGKRGHYVPTYQRAVVSSSAEFPD